jgi:hypothetical protein
MVFPLCDGEGVANGEVPLTLLLILMRKPGSPKPNLLDVFDDLLKLDAEGGRDVIVVCLGRGREINGELVIEVRERI